MKHVVLLTGHFPAQHRKPSMIWISHHLQQMGWHVTHATVGYSWLSKLTGDQRIATLESRPSSGVKCPSERLTTLFGFSPVHPVSTRVPKLDQALAPLQTLFGSYWERRLAPHLKRADLVILESGAPVMLARRVRRLAPQATLIYRVSDNISLLNAPAYLVEEEARVSAVFDRISAGSPHLTKRFTHANITLDPIGIPTDHLKVSGPDPYGSHDTFQAVCAGTTLIDLHGLIGIARARPNWTLHVLGRLRHFPETPANLILHGEVDYETNLSYVAHADIGLAAYRDAPGVEYQTHNSNRILLYRHFGLPVLGPDRLCHPSIPSIIGYSDPAAYDRCETWVKEPETLPDWKDLALRLVQNGVTDPPETVSMEPEIA